MLSLFFFLSRVFLLYQFFKLQKLFSGMSLVIESANVETDSRCFGFNGRKRYFSGGGGQVIKFE